MNVPNFDVAISAIPSTVAGCWFCSVQRSCSWKARVKTLLWQLGVHSLQIQTQLRTSFLHVLYTRQTSTTYFRQKSLTLTAIQRQQIEPRLSAPPTRQRYFSRQFSYPCRRVRASSPRAYGASASCSTRGQRRACTGHHLSSVKTMLLLAQPSQNVLAYVLSLKYSFSVQGEF